ncbi:MAG: hypothetical protein ACRD8O_10690 [Bryobacteraceae bacterium]
MNLRRLLRNWVSTPGALHPNQSELVAFATGDLEPRRRREVFVHVSDCSSCASEVRQITDAFNQIAAIGAREQTAPGAEGRERLLAAMNALSAPAGCVRIRREVEVFLGAKTSDLVDRSPCGALGAEHKVAAVQRTLETFLGRRAGQALCGQLLQLAEGV